MRSERWEVIGAMGIARSFRDLRVYQLARKAVADIFDATATFPMLARMIDRASDFCKYSSDTDYREIVNEEPFLADDSFLSDLDEAMP